MYFFEGGIFTVENLYTGGKNWATKQVEDSEA